MSSIRQRFPRSVASAAHIVSFHLTIVGAMYWCQDVRDMVLEHPESFPVSDGEDEAEVFVDGRLFDSLRDEVQVAIGSLGALI